MPAWLAITLEQVRAEAAVARIEGSVSTDLGEISSMFDTLRAGVVAEIRSKIATPGSNVLDADASKVPPEWVGYACLRILSRMLSRPGAGEETSWRLTEDQRRELERREADLTKVAEGKLAVSAPETPATEAEVTSLASGIAIGGRSRRWDRDSLDGL